MTKYTQYKTIQGQRWDNVAYAAYGDASLFPSIVEANPGLPAYDVLPAGTILRVPVIEVPETTTDELLLPPWKRETTEGEATAVASVPQFISIQSQIPGSFDDSFE
jgi:phage tail protein X